MVVVHRSTSRSASHLRIFVASFIDEQKIRASIRWCEVDFHIVLIYYIIKYLWIIYPRDIVALQEQVYTNIVVSGFVVQS